MQTFATSYQVPSLSFSPPLLSMCLLDCVACLMCLSLPIRYAPARRLSILFQSPSFLSQSSSCNTFLTRWQTKFLFKSEVMKKRRALKQTTIEICTACFMEGILILLNTFSPSQDTAVQTPPPLTAYCISAAEGTPLPSCVDLGVVLSADPQQAYLGNEVSGPHIVYSGVK